MAEIKLSASKAKEQLWRIGHLSWLLDSNQASLYELFHKDPSRVQTWLLARRSGKSYALCVLAIEYCLKHPNSVIKYVAPTKDQVENYILPIIDNDILYNGNCPQDLKPQYHKAKKQYVFKNGSVIQLCGAEAGNIDSIRGGFAHIAIIDEAQDVTRLKYAITSVLLPTTLTTKGKVIISGTPPQDPDHEFVSYIERAEGNKTLIRRTVHDCPRHSPEDIQLMLHEYGGENSDEWKREFLCKLIKSKSRSVLPEVDDELLAGITKSWTRPDYYNSYLGMDIGGKDWTVVLFGYYDFLAHKIVIEDEYAVAGPDMKLPVLTSNIMVKELELCTHPVSGEVNKIRKRVSDHDLIVINEIKRISGYKVHFDLADKREKMVNINNLRTLLNGNQVVVNPRCTTLLSHLKNVKWASDNNKTDYARSPDGDHHYDAVDALLYIIKAMSQDMQNNPYPKGYNLKANPEDIFVVKRETNFKNPEMYKQMLGIRKPSVESKTAWQKHFNKKEK